MQMRKKNRWLAVLALLLCIGLCCPAVSADEAEPNTAVSEAGGETFFDGLEAGNGIGTVLFVTGLGCVAVGAVGILFLIVWQRASRRRDRAAEDREDIFDEIAQAEQRNRRKREAEARARAYEARIAAREAETAAPPAAKKYDPYGETGEIPLVPDRAQYTVERPIVPTTPVSMQPNGAPRPQRPAPAKPVTPKPTPAPAKPVAQKPVLTPAKPVTPKPAEPKPDPVPVVSKPAPARKFDLEDILREVRENNAQKDTQP